MEASLLGPALAYAWQHCVAGRPLLPGSALLELGLGAGHALAGSSAATLALTAASIPTPLALTGSAAGMVLAASVSLRDGALAVRGPRSGATHLAGTLRQHAVLSQPQHPTSLAEVVFASKTASPVLCALMHTHVKQQPAFQLASLAVDPALHTDGYRCHPAVVDATLHLGASLAPASAPADDQPASVRVPASVALFGGSHEFAPHLARLSAHCTLDGVQPSGAALSSYSVQHSQAAAEAGAQPAIHIAQLEARPTRLPARPANLQQLFPTPAAAATPALLPEQAAETVPLLYSVSWEAHSPAASFAEVEQAWQAGRGCSVVATGNKAAGARIGFGVGSTDAVQSASSVLATLQELLRAGSSGSTMRLASSGALAPLLAPASGWPVALDTAAAWGLLKVAASEIVDARWTGVDLDPSSPWPQLASGEAADAAGSIVRGGLLFRPMLRLAQTGSAAQQLDAPTLRGRVLVTGGLGGAGARMQRAWRRCLAVANAP